MKKTLLAFLGELFGGQSYGRSIKGRYVTPNFVPYLRQKNYLPPLAEKIRQIVLKGSYCSFFPYCAAAPCPQEKEKSWLSFSPEVVTSLSDRSIINTLSSQDKSAKDFPRRFWRENKYIGFCGEHLRGVIYSGREEYIRVFVTKEENFSLRNWSLCGSTYKGKLGFKYRIQKKENNVKAGKP